jgi:hypothetical protein
MKIGYVGIFNEVAKTKRFHGWGYVRTNIGQLQDLGYVVDVLNMDSDFNSYDKLFIDEGVNFTNLQWNKPGGDFTKVIPKLRQLAEYNGQIYFNANKEFPDYLDLISKRKLKLWNSDLLQDNALSQIKNLKPLAIDFCLSSHNLILGDSHATSVWEKDWSITTINGKTLWSFLKDDIKSYVKPNNKVLRFYAANIDIRFHFHRLNIDLQTIANELENQLVALNIDVQLVQPLPIESETRLMSSTMGSYKGKPFYGSQLQRQLIRDTWSNLLQQMCTRHNWKYLMWSDELYDETRGLKISCMEPRRGPHLSPEFYLLKKN